MTSGRRSRIAAQVARATQVAKAQAHNDAGLISTQTLPVAGAADAGESTYAVASCIAQVDVPIDPALQALSFSMPATITQEVPPPPRTEIPIAPELLMDGSCTRFPWNSSVGPAKEMEGDGGWDTEGRHEGAQMKMKGYTGGEGGDGEDSEWEYDWNDCEVHYVTLDVTIPTPLFSHLAPKPVGAGFVAGAGRANIAPPNASSKVQTSSKSEDRSEQANDHTPKHHTRYPHKFQLSSLVSQNPLVSYHNRIYSCEWTEPLGTEMFVESTPPAYSTSTSTSTFTPPPATPIHSSTPSIGKLVGISQTRLHGYPAIVVPKEGAVDHRLTRVDKGGKIAQGEDGVAGRTAFWKRLEEVKRRRKGEEGREGAGDSGNAGESRSGGCSGTNRRGNTGAGGTKVLVRGKQGGGGTETRDGGLVWVPMEVGIGRGCGGDGKNHSRKDKPMEGGAEGDRDAEDEGESNEDTDINSDDDGEYEYGDDYGGFGTQEHQQQTPVGASRYLGQRHVPHPHIALDTNPVIVTDTSVDAGHNADTEGDIEMGGTLR